FKSKLISDPSIRKPSVEQIGLAGGFLWGGQIRVEWVNIWSGVCKKTLLNIFIQGILDKVIRKTIIII
ncbi:hypothetical protein, partial [Moraxella porci]|uniref:hypothetical protein n=1 Tax=Moraxella porci TaxID=1288392 RepID=UPI00244D358A